MKKILLSMLFLINIQFVYAQHADAGRKILLYNLKTAYVKLNKYTDSLFRQETFSHKCSTGCFFVRFYVNRLGKIERIQTNNGTPGFLDTLFKKGIFKIEELWPKKNKPYLLPVYYTLNDGCKIDTSKKKYSELEWKKRQLPDIEHLQDYSSPYLGFINMLNFKPGSNPTRSIEDLLMEFIVLKPFILVNPTVYY